jgi:dTDP-4-dehydrorhamnose 3,5-epimerase
LIFEPLDLNGAYLIDLERIEDERGFFARTWDPQEFQKYGINPVLAQASISFNRRKHTLRGMHFQVTPHAEAKLLRCTMGEIYDVIVDLRPRSATFMRWRSITLSAATRRMLYVPEGFAHGFQTLSEDSEVFYQMSHPYHPESARGFRWDDPVLAIDWPPASQRIISARDRQYPDFEPGLLR